MIAERGVKAILKYYKEQEDQDEAPEELPDPSVSRAPSKTVVSSKSKKSKASSQQNKTMNTEQRANREAFDQAQGRSE